MKEKNQYRRFVGKNDQELIEEIRLNFNGKGITEIENEEGALVTELRKRKLIEKMVSEKIIVRKSLRAGFYENMTDEELIKYGQDNYKGQSINNLERSRGAGKGNGFIKIIRNRGLLDKLIDEEIILRKIRKVGMYDKMSSEELMEHITKNYSGKTLTELNSLDHGAYKKIRSTGLDDKLIENGTIILKETMRKGTLSNMSDGEMICYIGNNYKGLLISQIHKKNNRIIELIRKRGLTSILLEFGLIIRGKILKCDSLSDDEIIDMLKNYSKGTNINKLRYVRPGLYREIIKRNILQPFLDDGTFVNMSSKRKFSKISNSELINYITEKYRGKSLSQLEELDVSVSQKIRERGLTDTLVDSGVLIRLRPKRYDNSSAQKSESLLEGYVYGSEGSAA